MDVDELQPPYVTCRSVNVIIRQRTLELTKSLDPQKYLVPSLHARKTPTFPLRNPTAFSWGGDYLQSHTLTALSVRLRGSNCTGLISVGSNAMITSSTTTFSLWLIFPHGYVITIP